MTRSYFARLSDISASEFSPSLAKSLLSGTATVAQGYREKPPKQAVISEQWIGIGSLRGGGLYLDLPGVISERTVKKKWRWFTVTCMASNTKMFDERPFTRLQAKQEDLRMFALLTYFIISHAISSPTPLSTSAEAGEKALNEWERYLGVTAEDISSIYTGAFGELYVLHRLVQELGAQAVRWWDGPHKAPQDFRLQIGEKEPVGIEVKTVSSNAEALQINGDKQLYPPGVLLAVRVGGAESALYRGSVGELVIQIKKCLEQHQNDLQEFDTKLSLLGLAVDNDEYQAEKSIAEVDCWSMGNLPRISVDGPGEDLLGPIHAILRPGPGRPVGTNSLLEVINTEIDLGGQNGVGQ